MSDHIEIAPGVTRHVAHRQAVYTGTPAAIVAAGLARAQDLPESGSWTLNADGTRATNGNNRGRGSEPGKRTISITQRGRSTVVQVRLQLSAQRMQAIAAEQQRATALRFPRLGGGFIYLGPRPIEVHA
ncbi:hypothetical protein LJR066_005738 [Acidovorax sp. LjRoot66]|uniref:hypothetical protein n=1 Tax=Acidovorax sp. LjRoot66 TaxID=3342334 RepID=UPI003ECDE698